MRPVSRAVLLALALVAPGWASAESPVKACMAEDGTVTRLCILERMEAEPGLGQGVECTGMICRVELECTGAASGGRSCTGSGYSVGIDWNEGPESGFDLVITDPGGAVSRHTQCGICGGGGLQEDCAGCARPQHVEGPLAEVDLLIFAGGALLEYSVAAPDAMLAKATIPTETYRVPSGSTFNVRSGPGTSHSVVFQIGPGTGGIVMEGDCRPPERSGGNSDWCPILHDGRKGWISSSGLEREQ